MVLKHIKTTILNTSKDAKTFCIILLLDYQKRIYNPSGCLKTKTQNILINANKNTMQYKNKSQTMFLTEGLYYMEIRMNLTYDSVSGPYYIVTRNMRIININIACLD